MRSDAVRRLTLTALLGALGIVLKIVFQVTTTPDFRLSFYELPLIIAGMTLGPVPGMIAGFATDGVYGLAMGYGLNLMTVSTMMWGLVAGIILYKRKLTLFRLGLTVVIASTIVFAINTVQLVLWELQDDMRLALMTVIARMPIRIIIMLIKWPIQVYLIKLIHTRVIMKSAYSVLFEKG